MPVTAPDLTTTMPRSGREMLGGFAWLARLADKARAERAGTNGEYVAYCPLSMAFLDAAGVQRSDVEALIARGADDGELAAFFTSHVDDAHREAANRTVLEDHADSLDAQDAEEGRG